MKKIYLKVPKIDELYYRKEWLKDEKTMSYNAGYDMDLKGYDKETGVILKSDEEMISWYKNWIGHEPTKYFAYVYECSTGIPIGEVYFYKSELEYKMGILIKNEYRGKGYSKDALIALMKIAFEKYDISKLTDIVSSDRSSAIKLFQSCGFVFDEDIEEIVFVEKKLAKKFTITKEEYLNLGAKYEDTGEDLRTEINLLDIGEKEENRCQKGEDGFKTDPKERRKKDQRPEDDCL